MRGFFVSFYVHFQAPKAHFLRFDNFVNSTWSFAKQQWAVIGSPSAALTYLNEDLVSQQFPASSGNVSGADNNVRTGLIDRFCWSGTPSEGTPPPTTA